MEEFKRNAINQPYFFPYIGFFQLLHAVDKYISLEDVNFIPGGWINRNRILINEKASYFTLPIEDASQNKKINETRFLKYDGWKNDLLKKLRISYSRAPYYTNCYKIVENTLNTPSDLISDIAFQSILEVCNYIGLRREFGKSTATDNLKGVYKLIAICKKENATVYVNLPGGKGLYSKEYFTENGIELKFLEPEIEEYKQFGGPFVPGLSILDVLMFNPPDKVLEMISSYKLS